MSGAENKKVLASPALILMTVVAIVNLRNLPIIASLGAQAILFCSLAALLFLIPSALACAELASNCPEEGGLYAWVRKALGEQWGFFAIWSEWFNNLFGFVATLLFLSATLAYVFEPSLVHNKFFLVLSMFAILWIGTFLSFFGIRVASWIGMSGAIVGTLLPAILIMSLASIWLIGGWHSQISLHIPTIFPVLSLNQFGLFIAIMSSYAGMQITSFHSSNVINPKKTFPRAMIKSALIIFLLTLFSGLSIASVVPRQQLILFAGVMEAFEYFFSAFHMQAFVPIIAVMIMWGGFAALSSWLLAPARGLHVAAKRGFLPKKLMATNQQNMPVNILLLQAAIVSALISVFLFLPSVNVAFWLFVVLTSQFTMVMTILLFVSLLRLRKRHDVNNHFVIPGGKIGLNICAGFGIISCSFAIVVSFLPPIKLLMGNNSNYEELLLLGDMTYLIIPIILFLLFRKGHQKITLSTKSISLAKILPKQ